MEKQGPDLMIYKDNNIVVAHAPIPYLLSIS